MFNISPDTATTLYSWSYIGFIMAGVIGLISTGVAFWTNGIKEDASKKEIAVLNLKAEELRQKNIEAEKQLQQLRIDQGPRASKAGLAFLGGNGGLPSVLKINPTGKVLVWFLAHDKEAEGFAREIWFEIHESKWTLPDEWLPIPNDMQAKEEEALRHAKRVNGAFSYVPIDGSTPLLLAANDGRFLNEPSSIAMRDGLLKCGFTVGTGNNPALPPDTLVIVVGQKQ